MFEFSKQYHYSKMPAFHFKNHTFFDKQFMNKTNMPLFDEIRPLLIGSIFLLSKDATIYQ